MKKEEAKIGYQYIAEKDMSKDCSYHSAFHINKGVASSSIGQVVDDIEDIQFLEDDVRISNLQHIIQQGQTRHPSFSIKKGDILTCIATDEIKRSARWARPAQVNFYSIEPHSDLGKEDKEYISNHIIVIHDHRYLKEHEVQTPIGASPRKKKAMQLKFKVKQVEEEMEKHESKLAAWRKHLKELRTRIENLENFDSDEEAFAYRISVIMNESGGDKDKIQEILEGFGGVKSLYGGGV